jgi:hypothetical protein
MQAEYIDAIWPIQQQLDVGSNAARKQSESRDAMHTIEKKDVTLTICAASQRRFESHLQSKDAWCSFG